MELLQSYITGLLNKKAADIAELFDNLAKYDDYNLTGMFSTETHLIGKVAIDMYFSNRFVFYTYIVTGGKVLDDNTAEITFMVGEEAKTAKVLLGGVSPEGKITKLTIASAN